MADRAERHIEDFALIGDCVSAALVGRDGAIEWLCWPRFDSDACFASLLGDETNGSWGIAPVSPPVSIHRAYQGDSAVLETVWSVRGGEIAVIDFMPIGQPGQSVVRIVRGRAGHVDMHLTMAPRFGYGSAVPLLSVLSDGSGALAVSGPHALALRSAIPLMIADGTVSASFALPAGDEVAFVLSYGPSHLSPSPMVDPRSALSETLRFWQDWAARTIGHFPYADAVRRSLVTLKACCFTPTGGIVAAPTTSLPEQIGGPRNWDYRYCWLRDSALTLQALTRCGHVDEAHAWRGWLRRAVGGDPEHLQIMYGLSGERRLAEYEVPWLRGYRDSRPVRVGNGAAGQLQLDVFGEVLAALTADGADDWDLLRTLVEQLETVWQLPDEGIWEVRGGRRHFTFSKVMAWVAFDRAIAAAERHGLPAPIERWRVARQRLHDLVCREGYDNARHTFVQSFGAPDLDASLLLIPLVGFLPADDPRVAGTIAAIEADLMVDGLVLRYRTEAGADGLPPGEGAFLACSFWLVEARAVQGRIAEAAALFEHLLSLCNDVGLLSEEYDPQARRALGNFPQAFSHATLVGAALAIGAASGAK